MAKGIDVDRGVMMRYLDGTGIQVYMYLDTPGVYLNAFGAEVSGDLARQAGFDVEKLGRERTKRERMATAFAAIEAEIEGRSEKEATLVERNGFKLIDIGLGRTVIKDPDGLSLVSNPVPLEYGQKLFDMLAPEVKVEVKVEAETKPKGSKSKQKEEADGSSSAS